ncbi:hypothetical protein EMCRGX_G026062 [Ephydatia muelleri]
MESIRKILTDISCSEKETSAALEALAEFYCGDVHEDLRKFVFTSGITKRLVGILRSLSDPSLLATATRCLSLIAYGDQDAKTYFARLKAIPVLLTMCDPLARKMEEEQRLSLYEQALVAVRTLTFQNSDNQRLFSDNGGVKRLVAACNSCLLPERTTYRAEAADKLATLVLGKKMICRAADATKGSPLHSNTVKMFPSLSKNESSIGSQYPAYLVDLADEGQRWVADQMIEANVALGTPLEWPDESAVKWTCVRVTAVEDGGHVWCQFLSKEVHSRVIKMAESLENITPPGLLGSATPVSMAAGSPCALYYDPAVCGPRGCLAAPQWCRGRVLEGEARGMVWVLAVDYGFTAHLPTTHLANLPQPCLGLPPQAVPCKLMGVRPLPPSFIILEHIAGIVHNMVFDSSLYVNEIKAFCGLDMLLELVLLPDRVCVAEALGALLCVSHCANIKQELGQCGAVQVVLKLCVLHRSDTDLMNMIMSLLQNLLAGSRENCELFKREGGEAILGQLIHEAKEEGLEVLATQVLCSFSTTCAKGERSLAEIKQLRKVNRERSLAKPVIRARLRDSEDSDGEARVLRDVEEEEEEEILLQHRHQSHAVVRRTYVLGSTLPFKRDTTHEFKLLEAKPLKAQLRRTICSLINTGMECVIYVGVTNDGMVQGIQLDRDMMDDFCVELDVLMSAFSPSIKHDRYTVNFVLVVQRVGVTPPAPKPKDAYIIELTLLPSIVRQFHTFKKLIGSLPFERCYYRTGCSDIKLSFHSLRQTVALEEMERCQGEMEALERSVADMEQAHHMILNDSI